jgi:hypothetical protein
LWKFQGGKWTIYSFIQVHNYSLDIEETFIEQQCTLSFCSLLLRHRSEHSQKGPTLLEGILLSVKGDRKN